ncbi:carbohydrate ABC transporter permease [Paenibacillus sp. strain BS8-2]
MVIRRKLQQHSLKLIMVLFSLIIIYPFFMIFNMSLMTNDEVVSSPLSLVSQLQFENYKIAFEKMNYLTSFKNTFLITFFTVIIGALFYAMAAYGFMRARRGQKFFAVLYLIVIAGHILPPHSALTPLVFLLKNLGLINTIPGLVNVYVGAYAAFGIFLLSRFVRTIPISLEESAMIDGCSPFGVFFRIILPLLKPAVVTLILIKAVDVWNDMIFSLIILQGKESRTLSLAVYFFRGEYVTQWNILFAALALSIIPVAIFYMFMQKQLIDGLMTGAEKG